VYGLYVLLGIFETRRCCGRRTNRHCLQNISQHDYVNSSVIWHFACASFFYTHQLLFKSNRTAWNNRQRQGRQRRYNISAKCSSSFYIQIHCDDSSDGPNTGNKNYR